MCLLPDKIYETVAEITPSELQGCGVKGLILDIDNTLAPRHTAMPDDALMRWIKALRGAGVHMYVISNNRKGRVSMFAQAMGVPYIHMGMKPFPFAFFTAINRMGLKKNEVAAVGDQIYTDVCGAHWAGIRAFLVRPICGRESVTIGLRRLLEKPVLRLYERRHGGGAQ